MAVQLNQFLTEYLDRPFTWGVDDCSLLLADWWRANRGTDPAAHLRGTYDDRPAGSVLRIVSDVAVAAGAQRTSTPGVGAFGVVRHGNQVLSAICAGDLWAIRTTTGIGFVANVKVLRAWDI